GTKEQSEPSVSCRWHSLKLKARTLLCLDHYPRRGGGVIWNGIPYEAPVILVPLCGRNPVRQQRISEGFAEWIPAFAGMTATSSARVSRGAPIRRGGYGPPAGVV